MTAGRLALAAAGSFTLCLGACASPGGPAPPTAERSAAAPRGAADGQLRQYRGDAARRTLQVTVTASRPMHVRAVALAAPGFATLPPAPADVGLSPGSRVDLPVPYGAVECGRSPGRASATLSLADAPSMTVELADDGLLARLHSAECAEQELLSQVALTVGTGWEEQVRDGRPVLVGVLTLDRRTPGRRVVVDTLGANIVYSVRGVPDNKPLLVLEPTAPSASVVLELTPTRCDPHALAESKATSLLLVHVGLDDAEPRRITVTPDPASRLVLEEFAVRGCRS
ncbi:MAG: hypothetical protein JWN88_2489 [Frankiales bacterium]|nr:hypothetical protein [Frankiales bacterium]